MKRLLGWLCAFLLALMPILSVQGEEIAAADQAEHLAVFYLHATKDADLIKTAKYVICALDANKGTRDLVIDRVDDGRKRLVFQKADSASLDSLINKKDKLSDGTGTIQNADLLKQLSKAAYDIWMVVPQEACKNLAENQEMMDQFGQLLENTASRIHLVLIGNDLKEPGGKTALAQLAAAYPGRVEWIRISSDFLAQNREVNADGTVHTGDYFLASFFGKPVDLLPEQKDEGSWEITLPESGNIYVLQRHTGEGSDPAVTDGQGNPRQVQQGISLVYPSKKNDETCFTGSLVTQLPAGSYELSGCTGEVKVYWYPNLENLQPVFDMGEETWQWGEQKASLSIGNALYRPEDFYVIFATGINDNPSVDNIPAYNPETGAWELEIEAKEEVKKVTITPQATLRMKDGNQVWSWKGSSETRNLESAGSTVRESAPTEETLYFMDGTGAALTRNWNEFFDYNTYEEQEFSAKADDKAAGSITIHPEKDGFTMEAVPGMPGEGIVTLQCGETTYELKVVCKNARDIFTGIELPDNTDPTNVRAGKNVEFSARIPEATRREWQAASSQLAGFPDVESLKLRITGEGLAGEAEEQAFTEDKGDLSATVAVSIPDNCPDGEFQLSCQVVDTKGNPVEAAVTSLAVRVRNTIPHAVKALAEKTDISLEGMPGKYEAKDFLAEALGTGNPFELFADEETGIREITVSVSNPAGLKVNDESLEETGEAWETVLSDPKAIQVIMADNIGDHVLTLTASDGVNQSEPISIKVHVYSQMLRIAMYAAAGLAALLLLLVLILVIRRIRKPKFGDIQLRCLASSDENAERSREIMNRCPLVSMEQYGKDPVSLTDLLILSRQPDLGTEATEATDDITLLPTKYGEVNVLFGKKAMERIGRHEKRDLIKQDDEKPYRLRIDNYYIQIEKTQGNGN